MKLYDIFPSLEDPPPHSLQSLISYVSPMVLWIVTESLKANIHTSEKLFKLVQEQMWSGHYSSSCKLCPQFCSQIVSVIFKSSFLICDFRRMSGLTSLSAEFVLTARSAASVHCPVNILTSLCRAVNLIIQREFIVLNRSHVACNL